MPMQYQKVRSGLLALDLKALVLDSIAQFMMDYEYAAQQNGVQDDAPQQVAC